MAGIGDWRKKQQTQAQNFLSSGSVNYNPLPVAGSNRTGCLDSSGCASGWACIGGVCVQEGSGAQSGSGNTSGCGGGGTGSGLPGECGSGPSSFLTMDKGLASVYTKALQNLKVGDVLLKEGLNGGTVGNGAIGISLNGKCLKTGCSGLATTKGTNDACCGQGRCCRMGSVVQCFCGSCPPPPEKCSQFCTSFLSSNGTFAAGCNDENTCDECAFCTDLGNFQGTACKPKGGAGPCYCGNGVGRSCTSCESCGEDGTCSSDCSNCKTCYTTFVDCDCGRVEVECCYPGCGEQAGGYSECRDSVNCDEQCPPPSGGGSSDPCAGDCRTVTTCSPDTPPPCPPKSSCRTSGTIFAGGQSCTMTEICDKSSVPDSCGECDCNCEDDCPDCKICNASGKCVDDPACADELRDWRVVIRTDSGSYDSCNCNTNVCNTVPSLGSEFTRYYTAVSVSVYTSFVTLQDTCDPNTPARSLKVVYRVTSTFEDGSTTEDEFEALDGPSYNSNGLYNPEPYRLTYSLVSVDALE